MLINIHTHIRTSKENQLEIVIGEDSVGIHPWDIDKNPDFSKAGKVCVMIGETGLDRSFKYKETLLKQENLLRIHLEAASYFKLPVVVHCVRAHSDLLKILKEKKFEGRILLHDYSGNLQQIASYLRYDVFFSFRRRFDLLKGAPIERIFLETDNQIQVSIEEIYKEVGISEIQFEKNLLTFFSDTQYVRSSDVINYFRLALETN